MTWDDKYFHGTHEHWSWIVVREMITNLDRCVIQWHPESHLCITEFEGSPISPSSDGWAQGWSLVSNVMVSPQLNRVRKIPLDQYDEWYIFDIVPESFSGFECFMNYGGFNLADPRQMAASFDPTWELSGLDWLYPIQDRFWTQMDKCTPITYIGRGDNEVVVTQNSLFAEYILKLVQKIVV